MSLKGKPLVLSFFFLLFFVKIEMVGQVINNSGKFEEGNVERKSTFNIEEIKVRWKKAALENCTGVPCVTVTSAPSFSCGTNIISDIDGNPYNTVLIGMQCWTISNLKVTRYNDGTPITLNNSYTSGIVSATWQNYIIGAYTIYDNESSTGMNASNYGNLYNWYAASDSRKLCPAGWHVPSDVEWTELETLLGGSSVAGGKLKSTSTLWNVSGGTNTSSFSALPGGFRDYIGSFYNKTSDAVFWSATLYDTNKAWLRNLVDYSGSVGGGIFSGGSGGQYGEKSTGASVRCLRD